MHHKGLEQKLQASEEAASSASNDEHQQAVRALQVAEDAEVAAKLLLQQERDRIQHQDVLKQQLRDQQDRFIAEQLQKAQADSVAAASEMQQMQLEMPELKRVQQTPLAYAASGDTAQTLPPTTTISPAACGDTAHSMLSCGYVDEPEYLEDRRILKEMSSDEDEDGHEDM